MRVNNYLQRCQAPKNLNLKKLDFLRFVFVYGRIIRISAEERVTTKNAFIPQALKRLRVDLL